MPRRKRKARRSRYGSSIKWPDAPYTLAERHRIRRSAMAREQAFIVRRNSRRITLA